MTKWLLTVMMLLTGCSVNRWVPQHTQPQPQSQLIKDGATHVSISVPLDWDCFYRADCEVFYNCQQWHDISCTTGVGVIYIKMVVSPELACWFAAQKCTTGKLLGKWTDKYERHWFEIETDRYHIRAYMVVGDGRCWIVYSGYRLNRFNAHKFDMACQAMMTVEEMKP